jgi:NADP-dependent aldehyde dehydrogenase
VAHNPVIAKADSGHPGTTRLLAEAADRALQQAGLPPCHDSIDIPLVKGRWVKAGLSSIDRCYRLYRQQCRRHETEEAADFSNRLIYLEMSSVNPVVLLAGALRELGMP